jgi:hypothetical protein
MIQSHPGQRVRETLSQQNPSQKRAGGVAQGVGPEFKPQCCKKKKMVKDFFRLIKTEKIKPPAYLTRNVKGDSLGRRDMIRIRKMGL